MLRIQSPALKELVPAVSVTQVCMLLNFFSILYLRLSIIAIRNAIIRTASTIQPARLITTRVVEKESIFLSLLGFPLSPRLWKSTKDSLPRNRSLVVLVGAAVAAAENSVVSV